jgi:hypothetical protein
MFLPLGLSLLTASVLPVRGRLLTDPSQLRQAEYDFVIVGGK